MTFPNFPDQRFMQVCWVVPDIKAAIDGWVRSAGVGPFFLFETVAFDNPLYRGKPTDCPNITAAIAQAGDMQIELVAQNDDRPSFWRDVVPAGKTGLHHMALYCDDFEANLEAYRKGGAEVVFSGLMMGANVCWLDTRSTLGFMVELVQKNPIADHVYAQFREAARNWDGTKPVRTLG